MKDMPAKNDKNTYQEMTETCEGTTKMEETTEMK